MTLLRRRATRERVLQTLYAYELSQEPIASVLENVLGDFHSDQQSLEFAKRLIQEVISHQPEIERLIKAKVSHWDYNRIAVIDKLLLHGHLRVSLFPRHSPKGHHQRVDRGLQD